MSKQTIIEIWWHGPFKAEDIIEKFNNQDSSYGLYQIYGTHNISGPNTLMYIGKACDQTFATRLNQHDWITWEPSSIEFYIGQLGGIRNVDNEEWTRQINIAESLLIYFCAPPYNTQCLKGYGSIHDVIILNYDKKNRLPNEVSTYYMDSIFWLSDNSWKEYTLED
jgi:hypothetical protein